MSAAGGAAATRDPLYARGIVLVMLAGCFWSLGGLLVRLIEEAGGWQILLVRSITLSLMLFCVLALRHRRNIWSEFRKAGRAAVIGGLCLGVAFSGFVFALLNTTVANTMFIMCASPFFTAPLAWLVLGERVRRATRIAMVFAIAGVGVMVADGIGTGALFGNAVAIVSTIAFAGFAVSLRWGRNVDMLPLICLAGVFTAIASAGLSESFVYTPRDLALCVVMGVVQIGTGMMLFTLGSRHLPATELALLSLTEVVLAPIWVWLALDEVPTALTLVGGAIVLAALVGQAVSRPRRKPPPIAAV